MAVPQPAAPYATLPSSTSGISAFSGESASLPTRPNLQSSELKISLGAPAVWKIPAGKSPNEIIAARLAAIMYPLHPGEPEFFAELRVAETSAPHAAAFDAILAGPHSSPISPVDVMWCFSRYEATKRVAKISIDESRGTYRTIGSGCRCSGCGKTEAIIRPIQVNAGDEGNKFQVVCLNPSCRKIDIME